jgi:tellurite resistance-related uncharacterized protein
VSTSDALPSSLEHVRTTPEFTATTVPAGLLRAHQLAPEVWGVLRVIEGTVVFVAEVTGDERAVSNGQCQVIPPEVPHHVTPGPDARFVIEFHR